jgi:hypothetical protein
VEGREDDRAANARFGRVAQVFGKRRGGVPRAGQPVARSCMAVSVNDHHDFFLSIGPSNE